MGDPEIDRIQFICNYLQRYEETKADESLATQAMEFKVLPRAVCIALLEEHFVKNQVKQRQNPNFIQLKVFFDIIEQLLRNF
jgi:hypothetical protein